MAPVRRLRQRQHLRAPIQPVATVAGGDHQHPSPHGWPRARRPPAARPPAAAQAQTLPRTHPGVDDAAGRRALKSGAIDATAPYRGHRASGQGWMVASSWAPISRSHAVCTASRDPGSTNTKVPLATPARYRLCRVLVPMNANDSTRNSSPNPSIVLSRRRRSWGVVLSSTSRAGQRSWRAGIAAATGLPGRPNKGLPPSWPKLTRQDECAVTQHTVQRQDLNPQSADTHMYYIR